MYQWLIIFHFNVSSIPTAAELYYSIWNTYPLTDEVVFLSIIENYSPCIHITPTENVWLYIGDFFFLAYIKKRKNVN